MRSVIKKSLTKKGPTRSFKEWAEYVGVKQSTLTWLISQFNGPKPLIKAYNTNYGCNTYYSLSELKKWWASVPNEYKK